MDRGRRPAAMPAVPNSGATYNRGPGPAIRAPAPERVRGGRHPCGSARCLDSPAGFARCLDSRAAGGVYFGVALQDRDRALAIARRRKRGARLATVRGSNESAAVLPAVWLDLDVATGVHKSSALPPDRAAALGILDAVGLPPPAPASRRRGATRSGRDPQSADPRHAVVPLSGKSPLNPPFHKGGKHGLFQ